MEFFIHLTILFFSSGILAWWGLKAIDHLWRKYGLTDLPHLYKNEVGRAPAPYSIWIILTFILVIFSPYISWMFAFSEVLEKKLIIIVTLTAIIGVISFVDDLDTIRKSYIKVPPIFRLALQILVGLIIGITSIKITYISWIFGDTIRLDEHFFELALFSEIYRIYYIPLVLTVFWYVLVFNSLNFSDGIPGLTGSFSLVSFIIMWGLAIKLLLLDKDPLIRENSAFLLTLLAVIIPTTFLMTRVDIKRLGLIWDSGTMVLAFLIATSAIIAWGKIATAMSVLGIYLIDALYVIGIRLMKGKNPMKWDRTHHLHFRLLELGLTHTFIRILICGLAFLCGMSALFLDAKGKIFLLIFITLVTLGLTKVLSKVKK